MAEQLTGAQDVPEGVRVTSTSPEPHGAPSGAPLPAYAVLPPPPEAERLQSKGRVETFTTEGPDGRTVTVTRDVDTQEQTTTFADGRVVHHGPALAEPWVG